MIDVHGEGVGDTAHGSHNGTSRGLGKTFMNSGKVVEVGGVVVIMFEECSFGFCDDSLHCCLVHQCVGFRYELE